MGHNQGIAFTSHLVVDFNAVGRKYGHDMTPIGVGIQFSLPYFKFSS
jgi:hypothetical protein